MLQIRNSSLNQLLGNLLLIPQGFDGLPKVLKAIEVTRCLI